MRKREKANICSKKLLGGKKFFVLWMLRCGFDINWMIFIITIFNASNQSLTKKRKIEQKQWAIIAFRINHKYMQREWFSRQGETEVTSNDKNVWKGRSNLVWRFGIQACSHRTGSKQVLHYPLWLAE